MAPEKISPPTGDSKSRQILADASLNAIPRKSRSSALLADLKAGNPYRRTDAETAAFLDALDAQYAQEEFALQTIQAREVLELARVA